MISFHVQKYFWSTTCICTMYIHKCRHCSMLLIHIRCEVIFQISSFSFFISLNECYAVVQKKSLIHVLSFSEKIFISDIFSYYRSLRDILEVVAREKACQVLSLFTWSDASDVHLAFLREKCGVNHEILKISPQMLKYRKILNVQIRKFSSTILIFSVNE